MLTILPAKFNPYIINDDNNKNIPKDLKKALDQIFEKADHLPDPLLADGFKTLGEMLLKNMLSKRLFLSNIFINIKTNGL